MGKSDRAFIKTGVLAVFSSRTSLASSRQSLSSFVSPTAERAASPDQAAKRASFVEVRKLLIVSLCV